MPVAEDQHVVQELGAASGRRERARCNVNRFADRTRWNGTGGDGADRSVVLYGQSDRQVIRYNLRSAAQRVAVAL
jgi:hypothetical protein